jgi:protein-tyrosine-phosphatase
VLIHNINGGKEMSVGLKPLGSRVIIKKLEAEEKTHTLMSFVGNPSEDVADPFMQSTEVYQKTLDMMKPALKALCKKVKAG